MGYPVWFGGSVLAQTIGKDFTATTRDAVVVVTAILLIGVGGSIVKPCISGTVQKTAGSRATLGFAIFYMVINIGSLFGRGTAFVVRSGSSVGTILTVVAICSAAAAGIVALVYWTTRADRAKAGVWLPTIGFTLIVVAGGATVYGLFSARAAERSGLDAARLSYIFAVAAVAAAVAFFVVLFSYREPAIPAGAPAKPKRTPGRILMDMVLVLGSLRFALFLLVMSGFFFIYNQVYNVLPLYAKRVVETNPAMDLYTAANPFMIVCFQLMISRIFGKMKPILSMVVGTLIVSVAMLINLAPLYVAGGPQAILASWLPIASVFIILTVALIALGELFTSARMYEYIGALAPKGQEGLFLGYANLPLALGAMVGGPVGALIFNKIMARGATTRPDGLLELVQANNALGWLGLLGIGLVSTAALWQFNRWIERPPVTLARPEHAPAGVVLLGGFSIALGGWALVEAGLLLGSFEATFRSVATLILLVGWTALDASVGLQMIKGKAWARGVFIVGFPTLWALTASSFSGTALTASIACWILGLVILTRPSAIAYFGEE
jgi:hypothetical protein